MFTPAEPSHSNVISAVLEMFAFVGAACALNPVSPSATSAHARPCRLSIIGRLLLPFGSSAAIALCRLRPGALRHCLSAALPLSDSVLRRLRGRLLRRISHAI